MGMIVELLNDWPRQEGRENRRRTVLERMGYVDTASVDNSCKFVCPLKFPEVHIIALVSVQLNSTTHI